MRQRSIMIFTSLALLLLLGVEAQGQGKYTRHPPTSADLLSHEGTQKTLVVQLLQIYFCWPAG